MGTLIILPRAGNLWDLSSLAWKAVAADLENTEDALNTPHILRNNKHDTSTTFTGSGWWLHLIEPGHASHASPSVFSNCFTYADSVTTMFTLRESKQTDVGDSYTLSCLIIILAHISSFEQLCISMLVWPTRRTSWFRTCTDTFSHGRQNFWIQLASGSSTPWSGRRLMLRIVVSPSKTWKIAGILFGGYMPSGMGENKSPKRRFEYLWLDG